MASVLDSPAGHRSTEVTRRCRFDTDRTKRSGDTAASVGFRIAGLVVLAAAATVPLVGATAATAGGEPSIIDLGASRWLYGSLLGVVVVSLGIEVFPRLRPPARAAAFGAGAVLVAVPLVLAGSLEVLSAVLSPDLLPPVLEELPPRGEPMIGSWLAVVGGGLVMIGTSGAAAPVARRLAALARGLVSLRAESFALVLGAGGVVMFVLGRYEAFVVVESTAGDWDVTVQNTPVIGIASLVLLLVVAILVGRAAIGSSATIGASTLTTGWVASLVPAMTIITASAVPQFTAPGWLRSWLVTLSNRGADLTSQLDGALPADVVAVDLPEIPSDLQVELVAGRGAVVLFAAAVLIGLGGLLTIRAACRRSTTALANPESAL